MTNFLVIGPIDPFGMLNIGVERPENPTDVTMSHVKIQSPNIAEIVDFGWDNGYIPVYCGLVTYTEKHQPKAN